MGRRKDERGMSLDQIIAHRKFKYGTSYGEPNDYDEVQMQNKQRKFMNYLQRLWKAKVKEKISEGEEIKVVKEEAPKKVLI